MGPVTRDVASCPVPVPDTGSAEASGNRRALRLARDEPTRHSARRTSPFPPTLAGLRDVCCQDAQSRYRPSVGRANMCAVSGPRVEVIDAMNGCDHHVSRHRHPRLRPRCIAGAPDPLSAGMPRELEPRDSSAGTTCPSVVAGQPAAPHEPITTFIAGTRRRNSADSSLVRTHAPSHAELESSLARVPYIAISPDSNFLLRLCCADALQSKWERSLAAYAHGQLIAHRLARLSVVTPLRHISTSKNW